MTYTPSPLASGDTLDNSRDTIRGNFELLQTNIAVNHVKLNGGADTGKHKFLQMPEQGSGPSTSANEGGLYTKVGVTPAAQTNLFFRGESSGKEYQLTSAIQAQNATFGTNTNYDVGPPSMSGGWTFLPGGLILMYGLGAMTTANGNNTITLPFAFPTAIFQILTTQSNVTNSTVTVSVRSIAGDRASFVVRNTSGSATSSCFWQAIGN